LNSRAQGRREAGAEEEEERRRPMAGEVSGSIRSMMQENQNREAERLNSRAQGGPLGKKCAALVNSGINLVHDNIFFYQNPSPAGEGSDETEREAPILYE
jgi:hypothetical protein